MPEESKGKYASALDAIEAVAEQASVREAAEREAAEQEVAAQEAALNEALAQVAMKRSQAERRLLLWVVLPIVIFSLGYGIVYLWIDREKLKPKPENLAKLAEWPVAVMLPHTKDGPVKDNACLQLQGFEAAFEMNRVFDRGETKNRRIYHFNYPLKDPDDTDLMMEQIKTWYASGIRTFIITMSGAVTKIEPYFTDWADGLKNQAERPILVATVASAPKIADREKGVFRHYIRSKDESALLAAHVESLQATEVYVFYVKDTYGREAKSILEDRLQKTTLFRDIGVPVVFNEKARDDVKSEVRTILSETTSGENAIVIIVGYGGMINYSIETIRDAEVDGERFKGRVLVVSTFTEKKWRPDDLVGGHDPADEIKPLDERLYTVGPIQSDEFDESPGVVYHFSLLTLDRALDCGEQRGVEAFWSCWSTTNTLKQDHPEIVSVEAEFVANGDSHVSLRLLNQDQWRGVGSNPAPGVTASEDLKACLELP